MKRFIKNIIIFSTFILSIHLALAFTADEATDDYYAKVSTAPQSSLILGTSRAFQGIIPSLLDSVVSGLDYAPTYNFAFTVKSSPFGKVYYEAIQKKVIQQKRKGYFIVTVDPWSLSENIEKDNETYDSRSVLYNLDNITSNPNIEYLLKKYPDGWGKIAWNKLESSILKSINQKLNESIHGSFREITSDGWLNVYTSLDSTFVGNKQQENVNSYNTESKKKIFSEYRMNYLIKTIDFLNDRGDVYLVRLPVIKKMLAVEDNFIDDFDQRLAPAIAACKGFLDLNTLNTGPYQFNDAHHLHSSSARKATVEIGKWINTLHSSADQ